MHHQRHRRARRQRALEEVVMAMKVRNDVLPFWTGVDAPC
jgi:hypothetical protein